MIASVQDFDSASLGAIEACASYCARLYAGCLESIALRRVSSASGQLVALL